VKANPAGILMIGIGVVLLNLAYTGRGKAVWEAIKGGASDGAPDDGQTPPPGKDPQLGPEDDPSTPPPTTPPVTKGTGGEAEGPGHLWGLFSTDGAGVTWGVLS